MIQVCLTALTLKCFYLENSTPLQFHFIFIPYTECLRLPWRSWSALLSCWLDCRKCHTFIHRGPISECGGEDPRSTLDRVSIVLNADGRVAVCVFSGLVRLAGAEYGRHVWGGISAETLCWKWAPCRAKHISRASFKGMKSHAGKKGKLWGWNVKFC